ncbi:hypothetical protein BY69_18200 [Escherichia coli O157:H7 str. K2191]|nr:hypothetical protein BY69_18200 [Escherichia coli O157:H7 str. K2191]
MTDFGGKTSIFSHPVYLFLREFSLQDFRGGSFINIWALNFQDVPSGTIKADPTLYYIFITQCDMIILGELHHGFFWLKATM